MTRKCLKCGYQPLLYEYEHETDPDLCQMAAALHIAHLVESVRWKTEAHGPDGYVYRERLDITCRRCGYSWTAPVLQTDEEIEEKEEDG